MLNDLIHEYVWATLAFLAVLFQVFVGTIVLLVVVLYVIDRNQTRHALRRNYPVIGRFRYGLEYLGEFFRQYFFAMDREELPFNRAQRAWCYRAAKNVERTVAFGSTRDLRPPGTVLFVNCPFPTLDEEAVAPEPLLIGPYARVPYTAGSVFNISGMSYGAISKPAVMALARGAKLAGCWLNTGEGGLSPYHLEGGSDIVFQIGTAKYGVRDLEGRLADERLRELGAIPTVRMFEVKLSQGAKPGKGGILPAAKVTPEVAAIRGISPGQDSVSPNRHIEVNDVPSLLDFIAHVREVTGKPTGIKLVLGAYGWLDQFFNAINARGIASAPDFITVDGAEGGTGAAPQALIDDMGLPLREALPLVVDSVRAHGLAGRIRIIASGKLITPTDLAWALAMGADFVNSARGFLFALGCIQALQCNKNTCPTGITTHDPRLQRGLVPEDKATRVMNYHRNAVHDLCVIAHACGVCSPRQLRRHHARIMGSNGLSIPLNVLHPEKGTSPGMSA